MSILVGAGPRATQALLRAARAWAALAGRDFVSPDDIRAVALRRARTSPAPAAGSRRLEGVRASEVVDAILHEVPGAAMIGARRHTTADVSAVLVASPRHRSRDSRRLGVPCARGGVRRGDRGPGCAAAACGSRRSGFTGHRRARIVRLPELVCARAGR